jgi:hypothetical protein
MKVDVSRLRVDFPEDPLTTKVRGVCGFWEDYEVYGIIDGVKVGELEIARLVEYPDSKLSDFWHNLSFNPPLSRPVVVHQRTYEDFRGNGISGELIILANEIAKRRFNEPMASDITFLVNDKRNWQKGGFAEYPAMRVWEKLEERGLAYRRDCSLGLCWSMR